MKYRFAVCVRDRFPSLMDNPTPMHYNDTVVVDESTFDGAVTALLVLIEDADKIFVSCRLLSIGLE
jgi:hypothetical protein